MFRYNGYQMIDYRPDAKHQRGVENVLAGEASVDPPAHRRGCPFPKQSDQADDRIAATLGRVGKHVAILLSYQLRQVNAGALGRGKSGVD
ncbi:hypothetical protein MNVI_35290 [Mycobacterium noviomagense]|uniref:Uncharacterized protein n=1 Tax=Mycobacterium noviomagense TaxID=459858 RepID=A0A7I7PI22_9MYCO|nr:hypothetical protein MNVI_35290 [Mycobacterium noviomagense]